nr:hypothetical protein [Tanacetum cinerariifolium]
MVSVPIHQDTSSVPPMNTLVIDLTTSQSGSPLPTSTATTSTVMTTTTIPPPTPQPQQSSTDPTLLQRIDKSYEAHEDHKKLYDALETSLERDYSDQLLSDLEDARQKKTKRRDVPRTPSGSPPPQPPPPLPLADASGAPSTSRASGYSQLPPPAPPLSTGTSGSTQQQGSESLSSSKTQELSPTDSLIQDDSIPDEQATVLVSAYQTPAENSLLAKTKDMTNFLNWYCRKVNKTVFTPADLEGQAYEVVKSFNPNVIYISHVTIQTQFFFNKDLECLRYGSKGSSLALLISKMKASSYLDFGLELLVPEQMWIDDVADLKEHTIDEKDFKNLYPSDFKDLNLLLLHGHLDHLPGFEKPMLSTAVKLWTRNLVIRQPVEDFQLSIESYQTQPNLTKPGWDATGYEFKHDYTTIESPRAVVFSVNNNERKIMRFNEIYKFSDDTSKEFIAAIERRLKTRRIYRNLECFVGGRVRDIDYRLLQRTE